MVYFENYHGKALRIFVNAFEFQENLSSCLSSDLIRRLCSFEWFYSAVDYTWFTKKEFVDSFSKPRRFSEHFLHEKREKRKQYWESVRQRYTQLCIGTREVLPTDLSHPLSLGQQLPETLRRQNIAVDDFSATRTPESQVNGHSDFGGPGVYTPSGNPENATSPTNMLANPIKATIPRNCKRYEDPQVPILYSYRRDEIESYNPPKKRVKNSEVDDNDIGCVAAVTLIGALQSGSSPQFSQKSYNKFECRKSTPVQSYDPMLIQSETTKAKLHISSSEHRIAFRLGGKEPVIGTYRRRTGPLVDMESAATSEIHQKGKNTRRK
ncbi:hypothetical protein V6N13_050619 [Hibiscus sabdariffa]